VKAATLSVKTGLRLPTDSFMAGAGRRRGGSRRGRSRCSRCGRRLRRRRAAAACSAAFSPVGIFGFPDGCARRGVPQPPWPASIKRFCATADSREKTLIKPNDTLVRNFMALLICGTPGICWQKADMSFVTPQSRLYFACSAVMAPPMPLHIIKLRRLRKLRKRGLAEKKGLRDWVVRAQVP